MATLFSADSALMRGLSLVADMIVLNLLFVATSIPVFTLGASLTGLNFTAMRLATGECNSVTSDYFRSFGRNFRQATVIWLLLLALAGVMAAWYVVVTNLNFGPLAELLLVATQRQAERQRGGGHIRELGELLVELDGLLRLISL